MKVNGIYGVLIAKFAVTEKMGLLGGQATKIRRMKVVKWSLTNCQLTFSNVIFSKQKQPATENEDDLSISECLYDYVIHGF